MLSMPRKRAEAQTAWSSWYQKNQAVQYRRIKENQARRRTKLRRWLTALKHCSVCSRCSFSDARALTYHHRAGEIKLFNIADAVTLSYGKTKIQAELDKCEILCANCHLIEHSHLGNGNPPALEAGISKFDSSVTDQL